MVDAQGCLECGASGAALRPPFQRRQRFRHARAPHRANQRCRRSAFFGHERKRRLGRCTPNAATASVPLPLNGSRAIWSAAPRAPLYGRPSSDAKGSGKVAKHFLLRPGHEPVVRLATDQSRLPSISEWSAVRNEKIEHEVAWASNPSHLASWPRPRACRTRLVMNRDDRRVAWEFIATDL
jgi:hypothetical protein